MHEFRVKKKCETRRQMNVDADKRTTYVFVNFLAFSGENVTARARNLVAQAESCA